MNDFFEDGSLNKDFDPDEHLADQGYGGEGVRIPSSPEPTQTVSVNGNVMEEEYIESLAMEYTQEQASLLNQADSRLEKANLYRMLLKHNLFGDVDCSATIINEVQEELKNIILAKLEVLLGIKAEEQKEETQFAINLPFNDMQVEALILWADKLTKGKSAGASPAQVIVSKESVIKPMGGNKRQPVIQKLSGSPLNKRRELSRETVPSPAKIERTGVPRKEVKAEKHREEWVNPATMTEEQRLAHNIKNQEKYKSTPGEGTGLPMPSYEQVHSMYQNEMITRSSQESPLLQNLQRAILETQKADALHKMNGGS